MRGRDRGQGEREKGQEAGRKERSRQGWWKREKGRGQAAAPDLVCFRNKQGKQVSFPTFKGNGVFCFHTPLHLSLGKTPPASKPLCLNSLGKPSMMDAFMKL